MFAVTFCILTEQSGALLSLIMLPQIACYLVAVLCLTFFVVSCLDNPLALLFLAPVLTFLNATLSGLIAPLPDWGMVLLVFSRLLPGLLACCRIYRVLGLRTAAFALRRVLDGTGVDCDMVAGKKEEKRIIKLITRRVCTEGS